MAKIDEVEAKLRVCIQRAKEHGVPITNRRWNVHWNEEERKYEREKPHYGCCAMACLLIYTDELDNPVPWLVLLLWPIGVPAVLVGYIAWTIFRVMVRTWYWLYDRSTPKADDTHEPKHGEHYRDGGIETTEQQPEGT